MARFIKIEQQQNVHGHSSFLHYLLLVIITMEFIPLPNVPGIQSSPIYFVVLLAVLVITANLKKLPRISPPVLKIILLLLFYDVYTYVLAWGLDILDEKRISIPMPGLRKCVELVLFSIACTNLTELKRGMVTMCIALTISAVFGLLVYQYGEPFQGIRDWLQQSKSSFFQDYYGRDTLPGIGYRVIGLSNAHWFFGYLMSAGPAIALICGRLSRFKWQWGIAFLLMLYALHLNGERAALLGAAVTIVLLLIRWRWFSTLSIVMIFLCSAYVFQASNIKTAGEGDLDMASRMGSSDDDAEDRLKWWTGGITSVIEHPLIGPVHQEYISSFFVEDHLIVVDNPDREMPISHNHYIDEGLAIGVIGWFFVLFYLAMFKNVLTKVFNAATKENEEKIMFEGISIAVLAPMLNAVFQNNGIFDGEPITLCLTGLLLSSYQILYNQNRL